ncbi:DUF4225 domain-containing protein [Scandinavium sp. V105_16]|uniref:DUF4225 domain-containing protein n=1 Tax=Scandinavium lactucae TaxID=3095028 RepID=A0AAJ2VUD1_9ENTR|nr:MULTISPECIES: DUF4225 domain-containing protein [unclassified Scandinavium]MDX6022443.1 DUF4225 domain-containing protein [Scandinavium sp. V105_16]MDX6033715.1 DUF4225 domain-containing protein [Scandinavium sp. V105_12]
MGTSAIAHLKYDLDNYVLDLQRTATLASSYFIENYQVRREYLRDIDEFIRDVNKRFRNTFDVNERMRIIAEARAESEIARREYQILRQGNYTKYIITEIFEDQGLLKHAKITGGVVVGGAQALGGINIYSTGKRLHLRRMKSIGITLIAHGANNVFESITPLLYEHQETGLLRDLYRFAAKQLGYEKYNGDFAYSVVDFSITAYSAYKGLIIKESPLRIASRGLFEKPGTGKLFHYIRQDSITKWEHKNTIMKIFQAGSSIKKFKATFYDDGYKFDESE